MALIETLDDSVDRRISECHGIIGEYYHPSVRPIFASVKGNRPELIGSCLLITVNSSKFVVTAAHIVDWCDTHALHVGGTIGTQPVQILGNIHHTSSPKGRGFDKFDSAFWHVSDAEARQLGEVSFLSESSFCYNKVDPSGRLYMAFGYPLSRNKKKIDYSAQQIRTLAWRYTGPVEDIPELARDLGVPDDSHLFLKFEKYSSGMDGDKQSSINPTGVSGGALIDLGDFTDIAGYAEGRYCKGLLAGMIIEKNKKHKALIAIKIQFIANAIVKRITL